MLWNVSAFRKEIVGKGELSLKDWNLQKEQGKGLNLENGDIKNGGSRTIFNNKNKSVFTEAANYAQFSNQPEIRFYNNL